MCIRDRYMMLNASLHITMSYALATKTKLSKTFKARHVFIFYTYVVVKTFSYYSMFFFLMHYVSVTYIVGERLRLVRYAIAKFKENGNMRKFGWNSGTTTSFTIVGNFRNLMIEQRDYLNQIKALYFPMCNLFYVAKGLYQNLVCSCLVYSVFSVSLNILFTVIEPSAIHMFYNFDHPLQYTVIPLCAVMYMRNQFQKICLSVQSFCYISESKSLQSKNTNALYYNCLYSEKIVDCGYFKVEWAFLSVMFHFVPLFVFAMLPQQR